jgi:hypothetical protein
MISNFCAVFLLPLSSLDTKKGKISYRKRACGEKMIFFAKRGVESHFRLFLFYVCEMKFQARGGVRMLGGELEVM